MTTTDKTYIINEKGKGGILYDKSLHVQKKPEYFPEIHNISKQSGLGRLCLVRGKSRLSVSTVFIVLAVLCMLRPLTVSAQQWVPIVRGGVETSLGSNMLWYYDSNSVKYLPDNKVQVSVKEALAGKKGGADISAQICQSLNEAYKDVKGDYSYEVDIYEFNRTTNEYRTDFRTYYDENGNILCKDSTENSWEKLDLNNQHYLPTLVYQAVCR